MKDKQTKILCRIRDIYRSIGEFEAVFSKKYDLCLNEGMLLCTLENKTLSSSQIADSLGLSNSNTSKVIKSSEKKELIKRILGETDKRQMYFSLTEKGRKKISGIKNDQIEIPDVLKGLF